MKKNAKIVALIPIRHHSERIPGKNYRDFAGKPLYHHIVNTVIKSSHISQIVIDTDSDVIKEDCSNHFPTVMLLDRPGHLKAGTVSTNDVLFHDVTQVVADYYVQTHCTNPLLTTESIDKAINLFFEYFPDNDSLFSVTKVQKRIWDKVLNPINHDPNDLLRTQDLEPFYEENSCLYIFSRDVILSSNNRLGKTPKIFELPRNEALDIDEEIDFKFAELMYKNS